jgi:hypothetical protein
MNAKTKNGKMLSPSTKDRSSQNYNQVGTPALDRFEPNGSHSDNCCTAITTF